MHERFWSKVDTSGGPDACWPWIGNRNRAGYGRVYRAELGRKTVAHRVAYQIAVGTIEPGLDLDHLCRNRACCNPAHLEPVTRRENVLRGESPATGHARKTHCPHGHPYNEENTYRYKGRRQCRACHNQRTLKAYHERTAR